MPLYDLACPECGHRVENAYSSMDARNSHQCPACLGTLKVASWPANALNGPTMTRPLDLSKQIGRVFTSPAEVRQYEAETGSRLRPTSDSGWKNHKHDVKDRAEKMALRGGYRNLHHMRKETGKAAKDKT